MPASRRRRFYDAVGKDDRVGSMTRGSFSLDLAAKRPTVGKVNEMFKAKRSGKDLNDNSRPASSWRMIVLADAIDRAKAADGKPRSATRWPQTDIPGEMHHHALEAGEVRREPGRTRTPIPVLLQWTGRQVRHLLSAASAAIAEAKFGR